MQCFPSTLPSIPVQSYLLPLPQWPEWLEEVRQRALKDATKMAMNGRKEDALYENADYSDIYNLQHVPYGSSSGYFARIQGTVGLWCSYVTG